MGDPAAAYIEENPAEKRGQKEGRPDDGHDAEAGGLDGDHLVITGNSPVNDGHGEEQGNGNRVGQGAGNDVGEQAGQFAGGEQAAPHGLGRDHEQDEDRGHGEK